VVLLLLAVMNARVFETGIYRQVAEWERQGDTPRFAKMADIASLVLWVCIVIAGRMIAYNWFDKHS
jgi:hypothetical protein